MPIETEVLKEGFDLPMNFIIEFEFKLTESNNFESDEEQFIFQGSERFTYCVIGIFCFVFSPKVTNINDALGIKDGMAGSRMPLLSTRKGTQHDIQLSGKIHLRIIPYYTTKS